MRGFMNHRLGPKEDGNHLGGNAFWRVALHVLTKLPSIRGNNWLANNVRGHCFIEAGGLANVGSSSIFKWLNGNLVPARITSGVGLVIKLGPYGRAELNYATPLKFGMSDSIHHGLQFGIGLNYS